MDAGAAWQMSVITAVMVQTHRAEERKSSSGWDRGLKKVAQR